MVVLRGALIRTGIGALIVGAGELVYQFTRLVRAAGGFGEAMSLLKDLAVEVWRRMQWGAFAFADGAEAAFQTLRVGFLDLVADLADSWADFTGLFGAELGREMASGLRTAAAAAGSLSDSLASSAAGWAALATAPLESVAALKALLKETGEEGAASLGQVAEALAQIDDAAGDEGGKGKKADKGAKSTIDKIKESAERLSDTMQGVKSAMGGAFSAIFTGAKTADQAITDMLALDADMPRSPQMSRTYCCRAGTARTTC